MAVSDLDYVGGIRAAQAKRAGIRSDAIQTARNRLRDRELNRDRTTGELLFDAGAAGLGGAVNLGQSFYGLGNLATFGGLEAVTGMSDNFARTKQVINDSKSAQFRYQQMENDRAFEEEGILGGVKDFITNPGLMLDLGLSQGPSVLPAAAVGKAAAARTLNTLGGTNLSRKAIQTAADKSATKAAVFTGGAQMGGAGYVEAYNQAINEGLSPSEANARALAAGASTAVAGMAISKLPGVGAAGAEGAAAARLAGVPGAGANFARTVGGAARRETTEEYLQSGTEKAILNVASVEKGLMDGVARSAAMGAVGGGLLGTGMGVVPAASGFRKELREVMDQTAADAGVEDLASSNLEKQGEIDLQNQAAIAAANENDLLADMGYVVVGQAKNGEALYDNGFAPKPMTREKAVAAAADDALLAKEGFTVVGTTEPRKGKNGAVSKGRPLYDNGSGGKPLSRAAAIEAAKVSEVSRSTEGQIEAALEQAGFSTNEDGTYALPNDVIYGEGPFTRQQALEIAAESDIYPDANPADPTERLAGLPEVNEEPPLDADTEAMFQDQPADLPEVSEIPADVDNEGLPVAEVEESVTTGDAYDRARAALETLGVEETVTDGNSTFRLTRGGTTLDMDRTTAVEMARQQGLITDLEAQRATEFVTTPEPELPPEPSIDEVRAREQFVAEEETLARAKFYGDPEENVYYGSGRDGLDQKFTREEALQEIGYVREGEDLLGGPDATRIPTEDLFGEPRFQPAELTAEADTDIDAQYRLRGIDPLFELVDDANRRDAAIENLTKYALPAPPPAVGTEAQAQDTSATAIAQRWMYAVDNAIKARNQYAQPINYTQAMRKSAMVRDFVNGAADAGIEPNTGAAVDYVADYARSVESSNVKAAGVIAAFADMVGANAPGTAPMSRWRKKLARTVVSPGQMKGPAYKAFKEAAEKATITPGSVDYPAFMYNFSASMTDEQANTTFGKKIREAFPYSPPAVNKAKAKAAKQKQVQGGRAKKPNAKRVVSPDVAAVEKTPRQNAVSEPKPIPATPEAQAAEPAIEEGKRATRAALVANSEEAPAAVEQAERDITRTRNEADAVPEDATGEVDPDVAAADAEQEAAPRPQASEEARDTINSTLQRVNDLVKKMKQRFAAEVFSLKAEYARASGPGSSLVDATQDALTEITRERLEALDAALRKDVGDIASWGGLVGTVLGNNQFKTYLTPENKYTEFVKPALDRFAGFIAEAGTPDGVMIYRAVFRDAEVKNFINNEMSGPAQKVAFEQVAELEQMMDTAIDRMTGDPANAQNVKPFKKNGAKYSTAAKGEAIVPMPRDELVAIVDEWNLNRPVVSTDFVLFDTVEEAATALAIAVPSSTNGIYYKRRAYVIAENVESAQVAREVIMHERTHGGLEALLGQDRLNAVMNRVWANGQMRKRTQAKMKRHQTNRIKAAEEVVVDMVVNGEKLNKGLYSKIRAAISRKTEQFLGIDEYSAPDTMVDELLQDTADYLRGAKTELSLSESYASGLEAYQAIFEGKSVIRSPMFSQAKAEMERWTTGETSDTAAFIDRHQQAMDEGVSKNWQAKLKGRGLSIRGGLSSKLMTLLPASQIADLHKGLFWTKEVGVDQLNAFVEDKNSMENENNKVMQRQRDLYYDSDVKGAPQWQMSMVDIAKKWEKLTNKKSSETQAKAINKVSQLGTFYKVFPDRPFDQQTPLDYTRENFTEADRRKGYLQVKQQWDTMNDANKELYKQTQATYASVWKERMDELKKQATRIADASTQMPDPDQPSKSIPSKQWGQKMDKKIAIAIGRIKEGPYSPLQRFGDFYVVVKDKDGKVVFSSGHDSEAQARDMENSMSRDLEDGYSIATSVRTDYIAEFDGIGTQQYTTIQNALKGTFPTDSESDVHARTQAMAAMEEVMLSTLPDHSLLKHANTRKGVAGFTPDAFRAFNDYAVKSARNLSAMRYSHKIQGGLGAMEKLSRLSAGTDIKLQRGKVYNAIRNQHIASQKADSSKWAQIATGLGYGMYMTSPSQLVLNASQTGLVTMPVLAAQYGPGETLKYMKEAFTESLKSKGNGMHSERGKLDQSSVMFAVMQNLKEGGTLDFTQTYEMAEMAQEGSDLVHSQWRTMMHYASTFMRLSEIFNRETAAYIVVRGEMRKENISEDQFKALPDAKKSELLNSWGDKARQAVRETQFIYNQSNKGAVFQKDYMRVIGQFQSFRANMLALIYRTARDSIYGVQDPSLTTKERQEQTTIARRTGAYMLVTQLLLTGPISFIGMPVIFALMDMGADDDDLLSTEERFLQATSSVVSGGLLGGILDPQRFGFNTLLPIIGDSRYMPVGDDIQGKLDHILLNSLGPMYGIASQWGDSMGQVRDGEVLKGIVSALPKPLADLGKVLITEQGEISNRQGIPWYTRTPADFAWNAMGLKTSDQASAQADRSAIYSGTQRASDRRNKLVFKYVSAADNDERVDAMRGIENWNRRYGGDSALVIRNSTLKRAAKTREEKKINAMRTGVPSTRTPDTVLGFIND